MPLIDSHCHIHMDDYELDGVVQLEIARSKDVEQVIVIGEGYDDSQKAIEFAATNDCYAVIGLHPHQAKLGVGAVDELRNLFEYAESGRIVGVGECGLDYYYMHSPKDAQKAVLVKQFEIAKMMNLPMVFHIRGSKDDPNDAYEDFFEIFDAHQLPAGGVVHSFSAHEAQLQPILQRGLYVGLNGIMTFSKDDAQLAAATSIPIDKLLLETDSPFLTPTPFRGKINSPQYVVEIAKFLSVLRGERLEDLSLRTYENCKLLFGI